MDIYYDSTVLGIRIMGLTEYGYTLEIEECIGEECWELLDKYIHSDDVQIEALYSFTTTLEPHPISGTQWVPLNLHNKNDHLNNRNGI